MKKILSTLLSVSLMTPVTMAQSGADTQQPILTSWGDQGNGTYVNPILNADYSDPDAIRVGDKYYMVASDFHFMGMQVLESTDLVNWTLIAQLYDRFDFPKWDTNERYAGGSWAPAIRYHDGKFWVFFCTPHEGLFMTQATDPRGPWTPLHLVEKVEKWEDPCPFWDEDGQAYLGRSKHGAGPIIIHRMSPDGKRLLDEGRTVYTGPVAEGTKIHKRDGYYYLSIPEGGVEGGWQTVLRSRNIYGPYEKKVVLEQGMTNVNGPHQGAMVDTPEGEWWFLHFQQFNPIGRVVHLQPMHWRDGWPVIGVDQDMNGIGEPVRTWTKPGWKLATSESDSREEYASDYSPSLPATSDEFNDAELGLQWQFNHNPVDEAWSLTERKGYFTLHALQSESFRKARNTLTQKSMGYCGEFTVRLDASALKENDHAGLACMGKVNYQVGIVKEKGVLYLYFANDEATASDKFKQQATSGKPHPTSTAHPVYKLSPITRGTSLYFRLHLDGISNDYMFSYSTDGKKFKPVGEPFAMKFGHWKGVRPALFCYNTMGEGGKAMFDWVRYEIKD